MKDREPYVGVCKCGNGSELHVVVLAEWLVKLQVFGIYPVRA